MKKIIVALLVIIICFSIVGCEKAPVEKAQDRVVQIGEQFLNYEITRYEALAALEDITVPTCDKQLYLQSDINTLIITLTGLSSGFTTYEDVCEDVEWIKGCDYTG